MTKTITLTIALLLGGLIYSVGQLATAAQNLRPEPLPTLVVDEPQRTPVVVVDNSNRIVDVQAPTRLDVAATERGECDHMGGQWTGPADATSGTLATCQGVDY